MKSPIVVISPIPPPYHGASLATSMLINGLRERGMEVYHIDAKFAESVDALSGFSWQKISLMLQYRRDLARILEKNYGATVIMTPAFYLGPFLKDALFVYTAARYKARIVLWFHMNFISFEFSQRHFFVKKMIERVLAIPEHRILVGNSLKSLFPEKIQSLAFATIHNGISVNTSVRADKGEEVVDILYLSNMGKQKGWKLLFDISEEVVSKRHNVKVHFYGSPMSDTSIDEIQRTFAKYEKDGPITYGGRITGEDKDAMLQSSDVFVFPSMYPPEAFPLVILEAMAAGLPIVATDVGAVSEALIDGEGGFLVTPGNSDALREKLEILIEDAELRKKMGEFNRKRYEELFTEEKFIDRWIDFLRSISSSQYKEASQ